MENEQRKVLLCPKCGSEIEITDNQTIGHCTFCDSLIPLPFFLVSKDKVSMVQHKNMLNRINKAIEFSQSYQFHRAFNLYDKLIKNNFNLNVKDAFPYFGKFLNQYGVTYIMNDSLELELVCLNVVKESIYENENYQKAIVSATDSNTQSIIKKEANLIDNYQKNLRKELIKSTPLDCAILISANDESLEMGRVNTLKEKLDSLNINTEIALVDFKKIDNETIVNLAKKLSMAKHLVIFSSNYKTMNDTMYRNAWMSYYQDEEIQNSPEKHITIFSNIGDEIEQLPIKELPLYSFDNLEGAVENIVNNLTFEEYQPNEEYKELWDKLNNDDFDEIKEVLNRKLRKSALDYEGWLLLFLSKHKIKSLNELDNLVINPMESYYFQRTYMYASRLQKEELYHHYLNCMKNLETLYVKDEAYENEVLEQQSKIYKKSTISIFIRIIPIIITTLISIWTLSIASTTQFIVMLLINIASYIFFGLRLIKNLSMGRVPNVIKENNSEEEYLMKLRKLLDAKQAARFLPGKKTNRFHFLSAIALVIALSITSIYFIKEGIIKINNKSVDYYYVFNNAYITGGSREKTYVPNKIGGKTVVGIEKNAFKNNQVIRELVIEDGVKYIESSAFTNCTNLEKVIVPESISRVINSPFKDCNNLNEFTYLGNTFKPADFLGNDYQKKMPNLIYKTNKN